MNWTPEHTHMVLRHLWSAVRMQLAQNKPANQCCVQRHMLKHMLKASTLSQPLKFQADCNSLLRNTLAGLINTGQSCWLACAEASQKAMHAKPVPRLCAWQCGADATASDRAHCGDI